MDETLEVPTTRCYVSPLQKDRIWQHPKAQERFLFWVKAKERADKAPKHLKALALRNAEEQFEKLGKAIEHNVYTKRCEYRHE